jgi:hypothetical protein
MIYFNYKHSAVAISFQRIGGSQEDQAMKVIITGATGTTGTAIVKVLEGSMSGQVIDAGK